MVHLPDVSQARERVFDRGGCPRDVGVLLWSGVPSPEIAPLVWCRLLPPAAHHAVDHVADPEQEDDFEQADAAAAEAPPHAAEAEAPEEHSPQHSTHDATRHAAKEAP